MRYIFFFLLICSISVSAQIKLDFDKRFIECEDKWIALPMSKDSTFMYGFVYLDQTAGLTFHLEGTFKISNETFIVVNKQPIANRIIQRLSPNQVKVALIPPSKMNELQLNQEPDWLKIYKRDSNSITSLFRLGSTFNAWKENTKALTYLDQVKKIDPNYKGLVYEEAFAYNALGAYDKAVEVITAGLKLNENDCSLYAELAYAQMNLKQVEKSIETCKKALVNCSDTNLKSQMMYNIVYHFYNIKDKAQFNIWSEEAKKLFGTNANILQTLEKWKAELNK